LEHEKLLISLGKNYIDAGLHSFKFLIGILICLKYTVVLELML
jgi:hypothetical protein